MGGEGGWKGGVWWKGREAWEEGRTREMRRRVGDELGEGEGRDVS